MACCAGCPDRPLNITTPCLECGPYGTICCLTLTTEAGEKWFLRRVTEQPFDFCNGFNNTNAGPMAYYVAGDDCPQQIGHRDTDANGIPLCTGIKFGFMSNLCGGLTSCEPCDVYRWSDTHAGTDYDPHLAPGIRQQVTWDISDDCSEVTLRLYYTVRTGTAPPFIDTVERYSITLPTTWLNTGLPITWTTPRGEITLAECAAGEPLARTTMICCWQADFVAPPNDWPEGTPEGPLYHRTESEVETCLTGNPRSPGPESTEQCGGGDFRYRDYTGPLERFPIHGARFHYALSPDYTTIILNVYAEEVHSNPDYVRYTWDATVEIPFTPEWFLTPIVLTATSAAEGLDPDDATLMVSVCGYAGTPCFGTRRVCVDLAYTASVTLDGTFAMAWTGTGYATDWLYYNGTEEVRVRADDTATPGTWDLWFDVKAIIGGAITTEHLGSEGWDCETSGVPYGGGTGHVSTEPVTVTIHECEPGEGDNPCLPNPLFATVAGTAYGMEYTAISGFYYWSMSGHSADFGGYRVQVFVDTYERYYGVPWAGDPCPDGGEMHVIWCYVIYTATGLDVDPQPAPTNYCIKCDAAGAFGYVSFTITIGGLDIAIEVYD